MSNQPHTAPIDATPRRWQVADPGTGGQITIAGWDWGGTGPLAILSHANGFCGALWACVAEELKAHYRVIAIDARGHGDSDAPPAPAGYVWDYFVSDLIGVAEQMLAETRQTAVDCGVGNSFGGIVTAAAAGERPGLFRRVVMLDPPVHPSEPVRERLELDEATLRPNLGDQARKRSAIWPSREFAREKWQGRAMFATWRPEAFEIYLAEGFRDRDDGSVELKCRPDVEATIFDTTGSLDTFEFAPRVKTPVLLVRAARGHLPEEVFTYLAGRFPNCVHETADAGHLMPLEDPSLVADLVERFGRGD